MVNNMFLTFNIFYKLIFLLNKIPSTLFIIVMCCQIVEEKIRKKSHYYHHHHISYYVKHVLKIEI